MSKRATWQCCACDRYGTLKCEWPGCTKKVCQWCARTLEDRTHACPFHRGDPPAIAEAKQEREEEAARRAGEDAANEAARILGVKRE